MPIQGFGEGYLQGENLANERKRIQLQAEAQNRQLALRERTQERQFDAQDAYLESHERLSALEAEAQRISELDSNIKIKELVAVGKDLLNGSTDEFNDTKRDLLELYSSNDAVMDRFGGALEDIRPYNPNDPNDKEAMDKYIQENFKDSPPTDLEKNVLVYKTSTGLVVDTRSAFSQAFGLDQESALIRRKVDEELEEARRQHEAAKEALKVKDPSYTGEDKGKSPADIATGAANAYKKLIDSKADPELISSIMTTLGYDINQEGIRKQLEALALGESADTALTLEKIQALRGDTEQLQAFNTVGANSGYGDSAGALVKELIDAGTHTIEAGVLTKKEAKPANTPARIQYLAKAGDAVANFTQKLQSETTIDGQPATWDNYTKWPKALQDEAALKADEYDTLTESKPPTDTMKRDLATLNQTLFASGRFVREGEESTTGPVDSAVNILKTYLEIPDQDRRIEKSHELAGILVAASLDERTSKYLFQRVANVFGSDYGQSFESALGGAELFLNTQKAKVDSIRNETTNPFTRARLEFYSSQIDSALKLARNRLQLEDPTPESEESQGGLTYIK